MVISGELELDSPVEVVDHCVCAADMRDRQGIQPQRDVPDTEHCVTQLMCSRCTFVVCLHLGDMEKQKSDANFIHRAIFRSVSHVSLHRYVKSYVDRL